MKPYRVLIVEDHPFQHEFLRNLFGTLGGFQAEAVWDGATALQRLNAQPYDLVVTDLFMPVMDGVQLIQSIARLDNAPALALMSVASRRMLVSAGLVAKNLSLEVLGLISKPVEACDILRLRACLDKRRSDLDVARNHPLQPARQCLLAAMQSGEIQAWFQPKKSLRDGRVCSAEALVRWRHPQQGTLLPRDFLPSLQCFGLEETLLWLMLEQTIEAQAFWRRRGCEVPVSINLPTHLLDSPDLADRLHDRVLALGAEPASIGFELLETSTTESLSDYYAGACRLRMKGFGLAQDDFGKGLSSYFNLVSTPFSELKIDRSLVHGCVDNDSLATALQSIVELSRKLGLIVTAEGVETKDELEFLRKIQCDQAQGFLICAAVSPERFLELLREDGFKPALN